MQTFSKSLCAILQKYHNKYRTMDLRIIVHIVLPIDYNKADNVAFTLKRIGYADVVASVLTDPVPVVCLTAITHACSFSSVSIFIIMNMDPCCHAQGGPVRCWPTATFHILPGMSVNVPLCRLTLTICGT